MMAKYIVLGRLTDTGRHGSRDIPQFRAQARERAKALGITFEAYLTMGAYDVVWVLDALVADMPRQG